jgi:hypothetical protein
LIAEVRKTARSGEDLEFSVRANPKGVPALLYRWEFGDGGSVTGPFVRHCYTQAGSYHVKLKAEGVDGIPKEESFTVTVSGAMEFGEPKRYVEPGDLGSLGSTAQSSSRP